MLVSAVIFSTIVVATVVISIFGAKAYKIFDTSIGGSKAYEPSIGETNTEANDAG